MKIIYYEDLVNLINFEPNLNLLTKYLKSLNISHSCELWENKSEVESLFSYCTNDNCQYCILLIDPIIDSYYKYQTLFTDIHFEYFLDLCKKLKYLQCIL